MMFRVLESVAGPEHEELVEIFIDGKSVMARLGQNLAALMLIGEPEPFRASPVNGDLRAPFCMMGTCFECLVEIDGLSNCQACLTPICAGIRVNRQL